MLSVAINYNCYLIDHYSDDHFMIINCSVGNDTVEHYKNCYSVDLYLGDHCMIKNCSVGNDTVKHYLKIKYSVEHYDIKVYLESESYQRLMDINVLTTVHRAYRWYKLSDYT